MVYIINKSDLAKTNNDFLSKLKELSSEIIELSCLYIDRREYYIKQIISPIQSIVKQTAESKISLLGEILPPNSFTMFIVPIDSQAHKSRLILSQGQTIRDILDNSSAVQVLKDSEFPRFISISHSLLIWLNAI